MKKMQISKLGLRKNTITNLNERSAAMLKGGTILSGYPACSNSCGGTCFRPGCNTTTLETIRNCPV
jgi:hypothetical protein